MSKKLLYLSAFSTALLMGLTLVLPKSTSALSGSDFTPGNIIDDALFYDGDTMTVSQIQSFLNAKVPVCDTNGTQRHSSGVTRAQRGTAYGYPPPFICLKDFRMNTPFKAGESGLCSPITAKSNQSAAQIIHDVGDACNISQKVLLVMLQKEQGLITDDWPWTVQYTKAMGYYCPDDPNNPGWCHPDYAGFFNQVYNAALQFQRYKADPHNWNHIPGANNNILYQANAPHCGTKRVYIENYATAGLYNYTPYTPNQAALNNLYGTGDACSAYGNRNFWRYYNDWFGTTRGSYLLRSVESATVYLVSGETKYPIPSLAVLNALFPMGQVKFVSQQYLNSKTTGLTMKRLIKGPGSTLYFYDAGIKLAFTSCTTVQHYGMTCGDYATLQQEQIDKFVTGPNISDVLTLKSGKIFKMENGLKREALDQASLVEAGINSVSNTLSDTVLNHLQYGVPIIRNNSFFTDRQSNIKYIETEGSVYQLPSGINNDHALRTLPKGQLDSQSIQNLSPIQFNGYFTDGSTYFMLGDDGKISVGNHDDWSSSYQSFDSSLVNSIPNSALTVSEIGFYKTKNSSSVYRVSDEKKAPIASWTDLLLLSGGAPQVQAVPNRYLDALSTDNLLLGSTRLVKGSTGATVYMIDGQNKRAVSSFLFTDALGLARNVLTVPSASLSSYPTLSENVGHLISCGSNKYVSMNGGIQEMSLQKMIDYGFTDSEFENYSGEACENLRIGAPYNGSFIRPSNERTIYKVVSGAKRPISSYSKYIQEGGAESNTVVVPSTFSSLLETGELL